MRVVQLLSRERGARRSFPAYLDVVENIFENLFLGDSEMSVFVIRMRAGVDNAVHIQVKIVEFGNLKKTQFYFF